MLGCACVCVCVWQRDHIHGSWWWAGRDQGFRNSQVPYAIASWLCHWEAPSIIGLMCYSYPSQVLGQSEIEEKQRQVKVRTSAVPKRGRSKRSRTKKHAEERKWVQIQVHKRAQKSAKGRKRALPRKNCKQRGLEITRFGNCQVWSRTHLQNCQTIRDRPIRCKKFPSNRPFKQKWSFCCKSAPQCFSRTQHNRTGVLGNRGGALVMTHNLSCCEVKHIRAIAVRVISGEALAGVRLRNTRLWRRWSPSRDPSCWHGQQLNKSGGRSCKLSQRNPGSRLSSKEFGCLFGNAICGGQVSGFPTQNGFANYVQESFP